VSVMNCMNRMAISMGDKPDLNVRPRSWI